MKIKRKYLDPGRNLGLMSCWMNFLMLPGSQGGCPISQGKEKISGDEGAHQNPPSD